MMLFTFFVKEVTAEKTVDFLRTLSLVKTRDPRIYDGNTKLYVSGMCTCNCVIT